MKPLKIFIFLPVFYLFGCGMFEKKSVIHSFPKKSPAKKHSLQEEQSWSELTKQSKKPIKERLKDLDKFIQLNKDKEIALKAYMLKARLLTQQKKRKEACSIYHKVVQSSVSYPGQWRAYRSSANCHWRSGKKLQAVETLEKFLQSQEANLERKRQAVKLQWAFLKNEEDFKQWKLVSLSHLYFFSRNIKEKEEWIKIGKTLIKDLNVEPLLELVSRSDVFGVFEGYLLYFAGQHFFEKKDLSKSKNYFKKALSTSLEVSLKDIAKNHLLMINKISEVNPYLIGVLVPLSGKRKALGEKILRGLYMGLEIDKGSPWQIVVIDSKSHPDVVQTQVDNLFYKHHVIALVGGLNSETAEIIAQKAEFFATPAILFSQKEGLSSDRTFIFQNAVTARQLLEALSQEVYKNLKIEKMAVLYPDDFYGQKYAELFSEIFEEQGGEVVQSEMYKRGEVDFKQALKKILQLELEGREEEFEELKAEFLKENKNLSARSRKLTPENLLEPKKEFSALFIPDSFNQTERIADHLKYFGIRELPLLGTNLWKADQRLDLSKDFPLLFVNLPLEGEPIRKSVFYRDFLSLYAQAPGFFEQRAYNSALFLKQALRRKARTRLSLYKELKKIESFQGAYHEVQISDQIFKYPLNIYKKGFDESQALDSVPVK